MYYNPAGLIQLQAWDDHGIKSIKVMARLEGSASYVELRVKPGANNTFTAGTGFTGETAIS